MDEELVRRFNFIDDNSKTEVLLYNDTLSRWVKISRIPDGNNVILEISYGNLNRRKPLISCKMPIIKEGVNASSANANSELLSRLSKGYDFKTITIDDKIIYQK